MENISNTFMRKVCNFASVGFGILGTVAVAGETMPANGLFGRSVETEDVSGGMSMFKLIGGFACFLGAFVFNRLGSRYAACEKAEVMQAAIRKALAPKES